MKAWIALSVELRKRDPRLRPIIDEVGPPKIVLKGEPFQALCEAILSQQLAGGAARAIIGRFSQIEPPFPKPKTVSRLRPPRLRSLGISAQKGTYLVALARAWQNEKWRADWKKLDNASLVERLTEVKGIGDWTAHMFLIFSLGRPDVFPIGDYGVRKGLQLLHGLSEIPKPSEMAALVPHWEGAYAVASWYLWQALDRKLLVQKVVSRCREIGS